MLRHQQWFDTCDEISQFSEVLLAQTIRRAERQSHAVQAQRVVAPHMVEHVQIEAARAELGDIDRTGSGARFFEPGPRKLQVPFTTAAKQ